MKVGDMIKVEVDGEIELRRIELIHTMTFIDGREIPVQYNPELNEGEVALQRIGMPPVILKTTN